MDIQPSKKHNISPYEVESRALKSEKFRTLCNMHRMDRYNQKKKKKNTQKKRIKNR